MDIVSAPLDSLHLDPANARTHGDRNLDAIRASLATFGQVEPLVVHRPTKRVIGGNGRLAAMRALGWTHADIVELDVSETQATALGIALNRTAELAEWDLPSLGALLQSLPDLDGVGFDAKELQEVLDSLLAGQAIGVNEDDVPDPPDEATTRTGDVWVLGRHRLLCGASSPAADVDVLLAGASIHLTTSSNLQKKCCLARLLAAG